MEIQWEAAAASAYKILVSNDPDFETGVMEFASRTGGGARLDVITGDVNAPVKGRYVRMLGTSRSTAYGYSFFEFRVYGIQTLEPADINIRIPVIEYLELALNPADATGKSRFSVQNTDYINKPDTVVTLKYYPYYTDLSIDIVDFRGSYMIDFSTLKEGSTTEKITGIPNDWMLYPNQEIKVELTKIIPPPGPPTAVVGRNKVLNAPDSQIELDGSGSRANGGDDESIVITGYRWEQISGPTTAAIANSNAAKTMVTDLTSLGDYRFRLTVTDNQARTGSAELLVTVIPPEVVDFTLTSPANKAMITDTRKPTLRWNACEGATKYEIFVNITRNDYDWYASGNLLDRYTKVGESTTNSFTMPNDLVDRWTYKWYVLATTPSGTKYSDKRQFGLYIPVLETRDDGVALITKDNLQFRDMNKNGQLDDYEDWRLTPEERVADLLSKMSLDDKVRQSFFSENINSIEGFSFSYGPGNGLINVQEAAAKTPFGIPTAFTGDKIGGLQTIFPTQLGLAATRDPNIAWQCGNAQRIESKETGFTGTLGPLAEVSTKVLYPRIHEGGGENAEENAAMLKALLCGMQGGPEVNPSSMLVTVKHWPSQGAGGEGPTQYDAVTIKYHMKPWHAAVEANAASVMPGYSSAPFIGSGSSNESKALIDYLRNEIEFDGFIMTDWLAGSTGQSIRSIGVGIDVMGGTSMEIYEEDVRIDYRTDPEELEAAVGIDRINDAARRVLEWKIRAGMFENPYGSNVNYINPDHHQIALDAARKSITLLTNKNGVLPLKLNANDNMVVTGPRATWPGVEDPNTIWQAIYYNNPQTKKFDDAIVERGTKAGVSVFKNNADNPKVVVVVIGERSYTHATDWADKNPNIPEDQLAILRDFKNRGAKVITVLLLPRPYVLTQVNELSDAILAVYRGGNGIGQAVAECIFGDFAPTGRLPFQLPRSQDQVGTDNTNNQIEKWDLPYDIGATEEERTQIRNYIAQNLPVPPIFGDPLFQYGHGLMAWGETDNTPPTAFDLLTPENDAVLTATVTFTWQPSTDPESSVASYEFYLDGVRKATLSTTTYTTTIEENGEHSWYVKAINGSGVAKQSTSTRNFTAKTMSTQIQINEGGEVKVYPNPFKDEFTVDLQGVTGINQLKVLDAIGKTVAVKAVDSNVINIDLSNRQPGLYILLVEGKNGSKVMKLMKK